jgi:uncharacterized protein YecE (DUF72 family)
MDIKNDSRGVYVGMGGWDLEPFENVFYPSHPNKRSRKLEFYCQYFDHVEVNATFYRAAFTKRHSLRWLEDVKENRDFLFTVKLYRGLTHTYEATAEDILSVLRFLEPLAQSGRFAGVVMQFPYSFTHVRERREYLMFLARTFQPHRLFVEVRHNSWNTPFMLNFFQENRLHPINVDLPSIKQHMPFTCHAWGGVAYFRMMGRNAELWDRPFRREKSRPSLVSDRYLYCYDEDELDHLLRFLISLRPHTEKIFVVFHNDPQAHSLLNGFQLRHLLRNRQRVPVPPQLIATFPQLRTIGMPVDHHHPLFAEMERTITV